MSQTTLPTGSIGTPCTDSSLTSPSLPTLSDYFRRFYRVKFNPPISRSDPVRHARLHRARSGGSPRGQNTGTRLLSPPVGAVRSDGAFRRYRRTRHQVAQKCYTSRYQRLVIALVCRQPENANSRQCVSDQHRHASRSGRCRCRQPVRTLAWPHRRKHEGSRP